MLYDTSTVKWIWRCGDALSCTEHGVHALHISRIWNARHDEVAGAQGRRRLTNKGVGAMQPDSRDKERQDDQSLHILLRMWLRHNVQVTSGRLQ